MKVICQTVLKISRAYSKSKFELESNLSKISPISCMFMHDSIQLKSDLSTWSLT